MGNENQAPLQPASWLAKLDLREQAQLRHAVAYAAEHASAGAPGHGQFLLIAKLAALLDKAESDYANDMGGV